MRISVENFLKASLLYFFLAVLVVLVFRDDPRLILSSAASSRAANSTFFVQMGGGILLFGLVSGFFLYPGQSRIILNNVLFAVVGNFFFHSGFTLMKTSMPYIVPFWADTWLVDLDQWLHLGVDPWEIVHAWGAYLPIRKTLPVYFEVWGVVAVFGPVLIAAFDPNLVRMKRYLLLYGAAWVVVGNILALGGMSAGPVYYDRVYGTERFFDLAVALQNSPFNGHLLKVIQENLWQVYAENGQAFGSGISAFPSVHVSSAMVGGLYLIERSRWLAFPAVGFVAAVLLLSVYTGYHYALDGYVSILVIAGLWYWLKRREIAASAA